MSGKLELKKLTECKWDKALMLMMNWWSSSISFYFIYHYYYEVIFLKCICFLLERLLSWHPLTVITFFRLFFGIVGIWHSSLIPLSLMDDYWLYFIILYFCHSCLCLFSFFILFFLFLMTLLPVFGWWCRLGLYPRCWKKKQHLNPQNILYI